MRNYRVVHGAARSVETGASVQLHIDAAAGGGGVMVMVGGCDDFYNRRSAIYGPACRLKGINSSADCDLAVTSVSTVRHTT